MKFELKPYLTEKALGQVAKTNTYTFVVIGKTNVINGNSITIGNEVESRYKVTVEKVNVLNRLGKTRKFGKKRVEFRLKTLKFAYVTLKKGDKIAEFNLTDNK